ncbi:MAG TPA: hypothetical protein PK816_13500 [Candidatus Cloacimonadota bacterium]|mgnify:CR=1 FL=1|jgi:predicted transcriptional regulator|nr:hypothetical protein [Candidatus Cloacimonadota bacterium]
MPHIIKPELTFSKRQIPNGVKIALLIAVVMGIWLRSCWKDYQKENIVFENIHLENSTPVSVDVLFTINNQTVKAGRHRIFIQVFTSKNDVITQKMTFVEIKAKSKDQYIKVLDKFKRPLEEGEILQKAIITLE